jgi:hypothetical protein
MTRSIRAQELKNAELVEARALLRKVAKVLAEVAKFNTKFQNSEETKR